MFVGLLAGTLAITSIKSLTGALFGLGTALTGIKLTMAAISKNPVFLAITAGTFAYDLIKDQKLNITSTENDYIQSQKKGLSGIEAARREREIRQQLNSGKNIQQIQSEYETNKRNADINQIIKSAPTMSLFSTTAPPMPWKPQQPTGEIVLKVETQGDIKASATVTKQDNISLILPQATTTLRI